MRCRGDESLGRVCEIRAASWASAVPIDKDPSFAVADEIQGARSLWQIRSSRSGGMTTCQLHYPARETFPASCGRRINGRGWPDRASYRQLEAIDPGMYSRTCRPSASSPSAHAAPQKPTASGGRASGRRGGFRHGLADGRAMRTTSLPRCRPQHLLMPLFGHSLASSRAPRLDLIKQARVPRRRKRPRSRTHIQMSIYACGCGRCAERLAALSAFGLCRAWICACGDGAEGSRTPTFWLQTDHADRGAQGIATMGSGLRCAGCAVRP
jgi:hypothetical protein